MTQQLAPDDHQLTWQGAVSPQVTGEWVMPWRIPYRRRGLFPGVESRAGELAGVRIAFRSDTTLVAGRLMREGGVFPIQLCCDGQNWWVGRETQPATWFTSDCPLRGNGRRTDWIKSRSKSWIKRGT